MSDELKLDVALLRRKVPNLTTAARSVGLRPATVSNLCTGKIPVGRAEVRTLVALASLAGCKVDDLLIKGSGVGMIETGIKVLDLFAPLVRGGTVGFVARPGMGQFVLLPEIFYRLKQRGFVTVYVKPERELQGSEEIYTETDVICQNVQEACEQIETLRIDKDVILCIDRSVVLSGELFDIQDQLHDPGARPVTYAIVDFQGESVEEDAPYGPLETLWRFDMELVTRKMYPAIDPVMSTSTILEGAHLETTHLTVQQKAKKMLRRYRELRHIVNAWGIEKLPDTDKTIYHRGEKLEAFLTQPFYVAEAYTKKKGEWLKVSETLEDIRLIIDGKADESPLEKLQYLGRLNEVSR
ncbi:helix-turn-helix domain-containing protein [Caldalkalibacillus salinus]|uniref:ATP synthase beta subunit C-terminal domain-containing protein n=1 Tax=Caldalkalibacillus salinus TaxID=2803787 RepID=UPI001923F428|nr:helix-turn-helix domain-containing protein [Caldalkalibacillus salinus]